MNKKWLWLLLIPVIIGIAYIYSFQPKEISNSSNIELKTYRDIVKGFSFSYPANVKFENNSELGNVAIETTTDGHKLQIGFEATGKELCESIRRLISINQNPNRQMTEENINGYNFYKEVKKDVYADGAGYDIRYSTQKNNTCYTFYEIAYKIDKTKDRNDVMQDVTLEDFSEDFKILDTMIRSLSISSLAKEQENKPTVINSNNIPIQQNEQDSLQSIANIVARVANFRPLAEAVYDSNSGSYLSLCSSGFINVKANNSFPDLVKSILTEQGVSDQSNAGIVCVATKDKYALEVKFKKYVTPNGTYLSGKHSYCVDSSGVSGDDTKYKIDQASFSCKLQ